ncbi:MAG TPA: cytochrome P450 [Thermomicrobiales bacterium]|nr:cytochrome P450 [Thermomicrobiales bacterium]
MSTTTIDFSDPAIQANPYPIYAELRREAPVFWNGQHWLISRYDDIATLMVDPRMSSQRVDATFRVLPEDVQRELQPLRVVLNNRMLLSDPPKHTRLRKIVMKAFSAKAAQGRREQIQAFCDQFLDRLEGRDVVDAMGEYATPLPGWTIADTLGVPHDEQEAFTRWSHDQVRIYDRPGTMHDRIAVMRQGQASMLEMKAYLEGVIEQRRRSPQEDLISELVMAEEQGDRLSVEEMVVMVIAILVGGNNSTAHLIGNAILTLLRQPEAAASLRERPELSRTTMEEVLRFESPVQATSRVATEAIEVGGQTIGAGDNVSLLFGSANRDEAQFPAPDVFDVARSPNRHLTFAHGPHFCLGSALARNVSQIAVLSIVTRFPEMRLVNDEVEWNEGFSFRSVKRLPVLLGHRLR